VVHQNGNQTTTPTPQVNNQVIELQNQLLFQMQYQLQDINHKVSQLYLGSGKDPELQQYNMRLKEENMEFQQQNVKLKEENLELKDKLEVEKDKFQNKFIYSEHMNIQLQEDNLKMKEENLILKQQLEDANKNPTSTNSSAFVIRI